LRFWVYGSGSRVVLKAHRLVYPSTLGWRVIKKKRLRVESVGRNVVVVEELLHLGLVQEPGLAFKV